MAAMTAQQQQQQRRRRRRRHNHPSLVGLLAAAATTAVLLLAATAAPASQKPPAAATDALRHLVPTRARSAALNALTADGGSLRGADLLNALTRGDRAAWSRDAGLTVGGTLAALASPRTLLEVRVVLVGFAGGGAGGRGGRMGGMRVPPNPAQGGAGHGGGTPEEQAAAAAAAAAAAGQQQEENAHPFVSTRDLQVVLDALHAHATAASLGPGRPRRMLAEADVLFRASLPAADAEEGPDALAKRVGEAVSSAARAAKGTRAYTRDHDLHLVPVSVMDELVARDFEALNARESGGGSNHGRFHMPGLLGGAGGTHGSGGSDGNAIPTLENDPHNQLHGESAGSSNPIGEGPGHGHAALTLYVINPHHLPGTPPYAYSYHKGGFEMEGAPEDDAPSALLPVGGAAQANQRHGPRGYAWTPPRLLTGRGGCPGPLNVGPPGQRYAWIDLAANISYWGPGPGGEGQVFRHLIPHPSQFRADAAGVALLPEIAALAWSGVQHLAWPPLHHGGRRLGFRPRVAVRVVRLHQALVVDSDDAGGGLEARELQQELQSAVDAAAGSGMQTIEVTEHRLALPTCDYCAVALADAVRSRTARVPGPPGEFKVAETRRLDGSVLRRWLSRSRARLLADAGVPSPAAGVTTSDLMEMAVFVFDLDTTEPILLDGAVQAEPLLYRSAEVSGAHTGSTGIADADSPYDLDDALDASPHDPRSHLGAGGDVLAVRTRGNRRIPLPFGCYDAVASADPRNLHRPVLAALLQAGWGVADTAARFSLATGRGWSSMWSLGRTPFGAMAPDYASSAVGGMGPLVSWAQADAMVRAPALAAVNASATRAARLFRALEALGHGPEERAANLLPAEQAPLLHQRVNLLLFKLHEAAALLGEGAPRSRRAALALAVAAPADVTGLRAVASSLRHALELDLVCQGHQQRYLWWLAPFGSVVLALAALGWRLSGGLGLAGALLANGAGGGGGGGGPGGMGAGSGAGSFKGGPVPGYGYGAGGATGTGEHHHHGGLLQQAVRRMSGGGGDGGGGGGGIGGGTSSSFSGGGGGGGGGGGLGGWRMRRREDEKMY